MDFQTRANEVTSQYRLSPVRVVVVADRLHSNVGFTSRSRSKVLGEAGLAVRELRIRDGRPEAEMVETLNHELAHFIAFDLHYDTSHGPVWKKYARQLGAVARARRRTSVEGEAAIDARKRAAKSARAKARREARK